MLNQSDYSEDKWKDIVKTMQPGQVFTYNYSVYVEWIVRRYEFDKVWAVPKSKPEKHMERSFEASEINLIMGSIFL